MIDTRREYDHLAAIYWPIAVAVFVVVLVLVVFAALRFRSDEEDLPPQRSEAPKTEGAYVLALVGVFAVLVYLTFSSMSRYDANAVTKQGASTPNLPEPGPSKPLTVRVTAARWNWRFDYPEQGVTEAGLAERRATLVVPSETNVMRAESLTTSRAGSPSSCAHAARKVDTDACAFSVSSSSARAQPASRRAMPARRATARTEGQVTVSRSRSAARLAPAGPTRPTEQDV